MPLKTDPIWIEKIKSIKSTHPGWGAERIGRQLWAYGEQIGRTDVPSDRTVGRFLRKEWRGLTDEERAQYRNFYWPESMERGDLPWEASTAALELLAYLDDRRGGGGERPSVHLVRWFWRVSEARPGLVIAGRVSLAIVLTINELSGKRVSVRGAEWLLAYRPWEGKAPMKRYGEALSRAVNRIPPFMGSFMLLASKEETELRAWMEWYFGRSLAEQSAEYFWQMVPDGVDRKLLSFEETTSEESNG